MHRWGNKKDMAGDDPPYLSVGTEVSAKYKGAFCEAKIRKVVKTVKCKVQYKNEQGSAVVNEEQIKGALMPGASVEVKLSDKKETIEGIIVKIQDLSQYTVVFDDGDIATLRRTALCLKSGRHFAESDTLDQLPLTHPEHFSTPVVSGVRGSRRRDDMDENSDDEEKREPKVEREEDMGKVVCVEIGDKKKTKDNWFPGLIVAPNAQDSVKIDVEDEYLVRSFKDGRYYTVPKSEATGFTREIAAKVDNPTLKQAVEKAISFLDKSDLPPHWDRDQLFGMTDFLSDIEASDTDSTDDEPREEKDHFVAQLYKFMDDRGTPINKGPVISSKDVDMYKLFKIVYKLGGYNRVTNRNQWKSVSLKLGYSSNQTTNVKSAYKKFLHSFEDFYRKLGCTLLTTSTDNKLRSRSSRPLMRDRDKAVSDKFTDKDENNSSNCDDNVDIKELLENSPTDKVDLQCNEDESDDIGEDVNDDDDDPRVKKEVPVKQQPNYDSSVDTCKDDEKFKKKFEIPLLKNFGRTPSPSGVKEKDEKMSVEKKSSERKPPKEATASEKKIDKSALKTKTKRLKTIDKKTGRAEMSSPHRSKRSLKEKVKDMVHKLKLKSANNIENDKKKRLTAEELSKMSQFGAKVKNKDDLLNNGLKTRKLSIGSGSDKSSGSAVISADKKSNSSNLSINATESTSSTHNNTNVKPKKNDDDGAEGYKRKSVSRKRKDEDKFSISSADSLINQAIDFVPHYKSICIGDRLKVYYEPTHESKVTYDAKVTNKRYGTATEYLVHYTGWNTRYDEWIRRSRIADNLSWTPTRTKKKCQSEPQSGNNTPVHQDEPLIQSNINGVKTSMEKPKRSSLSPVSKNHSRNALKSGLKQIKKVKKQLESKPKKLVAKDSDSSSETDNDNSKKPELQKTRSRTEKQKKQEADAPAVKEIVKETVSKKKMPLLKRTRSGSLKSENTEPPKRRKFRSTKVDKTNKTGVSNNIRHSMKTFVSGNKRSNRIRDITKNLKPTSDVLSKDDFIDVGDGVSDEGEEKLIDVESNKNVTSENTVKKESPEESVDEPNDMLLILEIPPLNPEKIAKIDADTSNGENDTKTSTDSDASINISPPVLKKEVLSFEEINNFRIGSNQCFATSYLAENLENKPKIMKSKLKKDVEELKISPSKMYSRNLNEKSATKLGVDIKEKTFFPSRVPAEKAEKNINPKKFELSDCKDRKDGKRNISTLNSYLNMDKIDSIKKVNVEKTSPDKNERPSSVAAKSTDSFMLSCEDDVYEFKEPEPLEFRGIDDRTILHRRPASRIFEDSNIKRPKLSPTASELVKENEESKCSDDVNLEQKLISEPVRESEMVSVEFSKCEKVPETAIIVLKTEENVTKMDTTPDPDKEQVTTKGNDLTEAAYVHPLQIAAETVVESTTDDPLKPADSLQTPLIVSMDEEEDGDVDEAKLLILEGDIPNGSAVISDSIVETVTSSASSDVQYSISDFSTKKPAFQSVSNDPKNTQYVEVEAVKHDTSTLIENVEIGTHCIADNTIGVSLSRKDSNLSAPTVPEEDVSKTPNVSDSFASSPSAEVKSKASSKSEESSNENVEGESYDLEKSNFLPRDHNIIDEVEIEVVHTGTTDAKSDKVDDVNFTEDNSNIKHEDEDLRNDLLLCEETIPKSPETKEASAEMNLPFANSSRISVIDNKSPVREMSPAKQKKKNKNCTFESSGSAVFENTPPSTPPEDSSISATCPSDEINTFTSAAFSLNEKLCSNKENERSTDNSEKLTKVKKFSEDDSHQKRQSEYDSFVKKKEKDNGCKADEPPKKKAKTAVTASSNGNEKDDLSDGGTSPRTTTSASKSSVAALLAECPPDLDSNQRIEYLEQKLHSIRKAYNAFKQEVASIDRRRKKLRRKEREGRMMTRNEANSLL